MPYQAALVMNLHCHPCLLPSRSFNITLFMMISSRFLFNDYQMSSCDTTDFYDTFNTKLPVRNPLSKTGRSQARVNQFGQLLTGRRTRRTWIWSLWSRRHSGRERESSHGHIA